MTASRAANLSLALVLIGWLAASYGALSQLGDYAPSITRSVIEEQHRISTFIMFGGLLSLFAALPLAGYAITEAKRRAVIAILGCVLPLMAMLLYALTTG